MSITKRVLAPVAGQERCHFLVQWRDYHAIQHGRTFTTWQQAAEFDSAIKAGRRLPRDAPGRQAALRFGTAAQRWLATKRATKRPSTADLYATELRNHVLPAFADRDRIFDCFTRLNGSYPHGTGPAGSGCLLHRIPDPTVCGRRAFMLASTSSREFRSPTAARTA